MRHYRFAGKVEDVMVILCADEAASVCTPAALPMPPAACSQSRRYLRWGRVPRLGTLAAYGGKAAAGILGLVRSRQGRAIRGRAVAWRSVLRCAGEDREEESTAELVCVRAHSCVYA